MESLAKFRYSLMAGAFAAGGSFFGKLPSHLRAQELLNFSGIRYESSYWETVVRVLPLILMIVCNVCNIRCFLKALQMTEQTIICVVLTASSNYVLAFLLGTFVYLEPLTALSGMGITLILTGLWFLCDGEEVDSKENKHKKEK